MICKLYIKKTVDEGGRGGRREEEEQGENFKATEYSPPMAGAIHSSPQIVQACVCVCVCVCTAQVKSGTLLIQQAVILVASKPPSLSSHPLCIAPSHKNSGLGY